MQTAGGTLRGAAFVVRRCHPVLAKCLVTGTATALLLATASACGSGPSSVQSRTEALENGTEGPAPAQTGSATPTSARGHAVPTRESTDAAFFAMTAGYLRGAADGEGGCLWLEEFPSGEVTAVVWPPGYTARFEPAELLGPDGDVVAREGDLIGLAGGSLSHDRPQWCDMDQDERWFAHEVVTDPEHVGPSQPPPSP